MLNLRDKNESKNRGEGREDTCDHRLTRELESKTDGKK